VQTHEGTACVDSKTNLLMVNRQVPNRASHSRTRGPAPSPCPLEHRSTHDDDCQHDETIQQREFHCVFVQSRCEVLPISCRECPDRWEL
jgi:hypothetical protein